MAAYYFLAVLGVATAFIFSNGILFALKFVAVAMIPCCAVGAMKWGVIAGDKQQKIGVPLVGLILLAFPYWLSSDVWLSAFGHYISGLALFGISAVIGIIGLPLAWGGTAKPG